APLPRPHEAPLPATGLVRSVHGCVPLAPSSLANFVPFCRALHHFIACVTVCFSNCFTHLASVPNELAVLSRIALSYYHSNRIIRLLTLPSKTCNPSSEHFLSATLFAVTFTFVWHMLFWFATP